MPDRWPWPPANAATPSSLCGSGYRVINTHNLGGLATIYLLYNGRTNCVVTWKTADIGIKTITKAEVAVWESGGSYQRDMNLYAYYAGPVKVDAPGQCIMWGGSATRTDHQTGYNFNSGRSHCG